ncbi:hypothetical protein BO78DRAFT_416432 [Aspergillus sclerotiicarbonarius CBS 121057]|uniref:Uncharacterized protein n=1 Tax=Aspergillus sclerotiicarbonarius (strain CBS 121057 / IBT 28362) TaxID=1448318 RepID=A0A319EWB9_ASPSB|nr:hypothetical protein BO78DRAFT_416432 [Aspergillus sclerotiicarbonarius CBS 121057]
MATRFVSSQLIQTIQKGGKKIAVEFVDKTTTWIRPSGFPATSVQSEFVQVVEENIESLKATTSIVAMKESEHQSDMDKRLHYTAFELDSNRNVLGTIHLVKHR